MKSEKLKQILDNHLLWLRSDGGERANLRRADLRRADLSEADLSGADLSEADLSGADLSLANLSEADLSKIKHDIYTAFFALQCPAEGAYIGWKKCKGDVLVKLLIPEHAKRSSGTSRKCRASEVVVLNIIGADEAYSKYNSDFVYRKGETVKPVEAFDEDRWNECSSGIHHFISKEEAQQWDM